MKKVYYILMLCMAFTLVGCTQSGTSDKEEKTLKVAVSIPPQASFVKAVGGDYVDVTTMIPPGNSPANYQPSAKEMQGLSDAKVYFSIDVPAEVGFIMPRLSTINKDIKVVELFEAVEEKYPVRYFNEDSETKLEEDHVEGEDHEEGEEHADGEEHVEGDEHDEHDHTGADPHIWLSPKRTIVMVEKIRDELVAMLPEQKATFEENAAAYIKKLEDLDNYIKESLSSVDKQKSFIMYHPSLGYFADDYNLNMVAIESSGKEATAKGLQRVIDFAKSQDVKVIFYQKEFSAKQAGIIAKEIDGTVQEVNILSEDYVDNLKKIADLIKENS